MKTTALTLKLLAALVAGGALFTALPAHAGRDHHDRGDYREWRDDDRGHRRGHARGHYKEHRHSHGERVVIREKVIVQRPVMREYYYERPAPVYAPAYSYARDPSIVIGVNVPPIVIPLR